MDLSMDLADLDLGDPGSWPVAVRALCFALVGIAVFGLGYLLVLADKRSELARAESREQELRNEFDSKRNSAASLDVHRAEHDHAVAALADAMQRLPRDTEIPGLIDDISYAAITNRLVIDRMDLGDERRADLYLELPIERHCRTDAASHAPRLRPGAPNGPGRSRAVHRGEDIPL